MTLRAMPALLLLLAACTTSKPLDTKTAATLHRIALIQPHGPEIYLVGSNGSPLVVADNPTLTGLLVASVQSENTTNKQFRADMALQHVDLAAELGKSIEQALRDEGYEVVVVTLPGASTGDLARDVTSLKGKADAALDIAIADAGYAYATGHPYEPRVDIRTRLTDLTTNVALYENSFSYTRWWNPQHLNVLLDPVQGYSFRGGGDLLKDPARAAAGLRSAISPLTEQIAIDLKHPNP